MRPTWAWLALILMLALSVLGLGAVASSPVASAASAPVNCNNHYNYAYIDYALLNPNTPDYSGHNVSDCTVIGYTDGQYRNMRIQCKWISGAGVVWALRRPASQFSQRMGSQSRHGSVSS